MAPKSKLPDELGKVVQDEPTIITDELLKSEVNIFNSVKKEGAIKEIDKSKTVNIIGVVDSKGGGMLTPLKQPDKIDNFRNVLTERFNEIDSKGKFKPKSKLISLETLYTAQQTISKNRTKKIILDIDNVLRTSDEDMIILKFQGKNTVFEGNHRLSSLVLLKTNKMELPFFDLDKN